MNEKILRKKAPPPLTGVVIPELPAPAKKRDNGTKGEDDTTDIFIGVAPVKHGVRRGPVRCFRKRPGK